MSVCSPALSTIAFFRANSRDAITIKTTIEQNMMDMRSLRHLELRLLAVSLSDLPQSGAPFPPSSESPQHSEGGNLQTGLRLMVESIEKGSYAEALASSAVTELFGELDFDSASESDTVMMAKQYFGKLQSNIVQFLSETARKDENDLAARKLLAMATGVACLFIFIQANVTGPRIECSVFPSQKVLKASSKGILAGAWDAWAVQQVMVDGCDILGKCQLPQYLILAKLLLIWQTEGVSMYELNEKGDPVTQIWWVFRALMSHQHILSERSASLFSMLMTSSSLLLKKFGSPIAVQGLDLTQNLLDGEASLISAAAQLECGLFESAFAHADLARKCFNCAAENCGLHLDLTGALGFRTIHQSDPKVQMVLVANFEYGSQRAQDHSGTESYQEKLGTLGQSEILLKPKLVQDFQGELQRRGDILPVDDELVLNTVEQALVLAKCLDVKMSNPDDELRNWQMAPYIEAVDTQKRSHFIVRLWCHLLRVRWERLRNRTKERAYIMMENLVEEIQTGTTNIAQRMSYVFCVPFPTISALLKEFAELKVSCGLVREALSLFEELELWDNLIDCYCLLEKKGTATHLIKERLKVQPEDPRLWCSLGDVTLDDSCYVKAWEASGHRFARAQRSLARTAYNRGDYRLSMEYWSVALALNPLHPDGWFALGSAALKAKEFDRALQAFTRAVQLDPDNAESWNNIAAINMHKGKSREAFVAFREALKFKRDSWQMWENFSQVAIDIGNYLQAATAINKVLQLSKGKRVDIPSLTKLIEALEEGKGVLSQEDFHSSAGTSTELVLPRSEQKENEQKSGALGRAVYPTISGISEEEFDNQNVSISTETHVLEQSGVDVSNSGAGFSTEAIKPKEEILKERELLLDTTGKLLRQVVDHGNADADSWGLQARWFLIKGDQPTAYQTFLRQIRALQGSNWQHNLENFKRFSVAVLRLCDVSLEIFERTNMKQNISSLQMLLRNTIKQAADYAETDDYKLLTSYLAKIQSLSQIS